LGAVASGFHPPYEAAAIESQRWADPIVGIAKTAAVIVAKIIILFIRIPPQIFVL
jgi:hypothetical protein